MLVKILSRFVNPLKLITWLLKAAGEGTFGPKVKAAYIFLRGKKGWIVSIGGAIFAFLVTLAQNPAECQVIECETVLSLFERYWPVILTGLGVSAIDDALNTDKPQS